MIGARGGVLPEIFDEVAWSTGGVLEKTAENARGLGYSIHFLPRYFDVDVASEFEKINLK